MNKRQTPAIAIMIDAASLESKDGLAWVIIGGLTSSLLLTLILVPLVYMSMENAKVKFRKKFAKNKVKIEPVFNEE